MGFTLTALPLMFLAMFRCMAELSICTPNLDQVHRQQKTSVSAVMRNSCAFSPQGKRTPPATGSIGLRSASTFYPVSCLQPVLMVIAYPSHFQRVLAAVLQGVIGQLTFMKYVSSPKPTSISAWWSTTWDVDARTCLHKLCPK